MSAREFVTVADLAKIVKRDVSAGKRRRDAGLHARILRWRVEHGWTVAAVARKLGISTATAMLHAPAGCRRGR